LKKAYHDYYILMAQLKTDSKDLSLEEEQTYFQDTPLFQHLNFFFDKGVQNYPGTIISSQSLGPLSNLQKKRLFELTHLLYAEYLIDEIIFLKSEAEVKGLIEKNKMAYQIYHDPYIHKIIEFKKANKLSSKHHKKKKTNLKKSFFNRQRRCIKQ